MDQAQIGGLSMWPVGIHHGIDRVEGMPPSLHDRALALYDSALSMASRALAGIAVPPCGTAAKRLQD